MELQRAELIYATNWGVAGPMATFYEAQVGTCAGVHPVSLGLKHMARYVVGLIRNVLAGTAKEVPQPTGGTWPPPFGSNVLAGSAPGTLRAEEQPLRGVAESMPVAVEDHWAREIGGITTIEDHLTAAAYTYTDGSELGIEGKGFPKSGSKNFWQRFPDAAEATLKAAGLAGIWKLSLPPSGVIVRFTTDATSIAISVSRPEGGADVDDIFAANGRSGFDVYARDPALGANEWRWAATETGTSTANKGSIVMPVPPGTRDYAVHLPVWVPVDGLAIGVPIGAKLARQSQMLT